MTNRSPRDAAAERERSRIDDQVAISSERRAGMSTAGSGYSPHKGKRLHGAIDLAVCGIKRACPAGEAYANQQIVAGQFPYSRATAEQRARAAR